MAETTPRDEALEGIRAALIAWRDDGVENPVIPVYSDVDGDGIPDFYGLNNAGQLTTVTGVSVADSVAVSDGSGVEQAGEVD